MIDNIKNNLPRRGNFSIYFSTFVICIAGLKAVIIDTAIVNFSKTIPIYRVRLQNEFAGIVTAVEKYGTPILLGS